MNWCFSRINSVRRHWLTRYVHVQRIIYSNVCDFFETKIHRDRRRYEEKCTRDTNVETEFRWGTATRDSDCILTTWQCRVRRRNPISKLTLFPFVRGGSTGRNKLLAWKCVKFPTDLNFNNLYRVKVRLCLVSDPVRVRRAAYSCRFGTGDKIDLFECKSVSETRTGGVQRMTYFTFYRVRIVFRRPYVRVHRSNTSTNGVWVRWTSEWRNCKRIRFRVVFFFQKCCPLGVASVHWWPRNVYVYTFQEPISFLSWNKEHFSTYPRAIENAAESFRRVSRFFGAGEDTEKSNYFYSDYCAGVLTNFVVPIEQRVPTHSFSVVLILHKHFETISLNERTV